MENIALLHADTYFSSSDAAKLMKHDQPKQRKKSDLFSQQQIS
jgi:hypothetical protein